MSKLQKSNQTSEKNGAKSLEKDGMGMDNQLRLSSKKYYGKMEYKWINIKHYNTNHRDRVVRLQSKRFTCTKYNAS